VIQGKRGTAEKTNEEAIVRRKRERSKSNSKKRGGKESTGLPTGKDHKRKPKRNLTHLEQRSLRGAGKKRRPLTIFSRKRNAY